ncbi:MAG: hypothetical protein O2923_07700 [Verrucomicrobia bacterium]|nr:hypothetical protein [Verrucomicrobiota bacterium]MDA1087837.1 hypothetical protein [Verrucomicrobiota bacterium]
MPYPRLDRTRVRMQPLAERTNRANIEDDHVRPDASPGICTSIADEILGQATERIQSARQQERPVILAFGAHTIKNGLGPVLNALMERGWLTHLATNGAAIIHDWEFSYLGQSSEHVRENIQQGTFGNWDETGRYINLALNVGAWEDRGYGESVGVFIDSGALTIPSQEELADAIRANAESEPERAAAAADLLSVVRRMELEAGVIEVEHRWKEYSAQATAFRLGIPFTGHPMIGHDIIYNHPMNHGAAVGRTAQRDFLTYAHAVSGIEKGVYLSIGSAVMSPMIFEKSLSMAQNLALQAGSPIRNHAIFVVDLAESDWDWSQGEPPEDNPAYYLRYNKSFSRMGGTMRYLQMDNRDFLLHLCQRLG